MEGQQTDHVGGDMWQGCIPDSCVIGFSPGAAVPASRHCKVCWELVDRRRHDAHLLKTSLATAHITVTLNESLRLCWICFAEAGDIYARPVLLPAQEAAQARDTKLVRESNKELLQFCHNPYPDIPRGHSLPPNAGVRKAMQTWREASEEGGASTSGAAIDFGERRRGLRGTRSVDRSPGGSGRESGREEGSDSAYMAKDTFVLYSNRTRQTEMLSASTSLSGLPSGGIDFESKKYENFLTRKLAGTLGQWESDRKIMRV